MNYIKSLVLFIVFLGCTVVLLPRTANGSFATGYLYILIITSLVLAIVIPLLKKPSDEKSVLHREYKYATLCTPIGTLVGGTGGFLYALILGQSQYWINESYASAIGIGGTGITLIYLISFTIGGLLLGFVTGAIIGLVVDFITLKKPE